MNTAFLVVVSIVLSPSIPSIYSQQDTLRVFHESSADLTNDGVSESIVVSAVGTDWDKLLVSLQIRSHIDSLLFADEWTSDNWCGGPGFFDRGDKTVEQWIRERLERVVDPESFRPGGSRASRFGYGGREGLRWGVRDALVEEMWKSKYDIPAQEHIWSRRDLRDIRTEFRDLVTSESEEALLNEVGDGPCFIYHPHWDALYGLGWSDSRNQFLLILFIG